MAERTVDSIVFDLMATSEGRADPYPFYEELRNRGPVLVSDSLPVWYLTGFGNCRSVLSDSRCGKGDGNARSIVDGEEIVGAEDETRAQSMLFLNPPDHTRLRGLVSRAFTLRRVESQHDRIEDLDVGRDSNQILSFASGIHFCLGASLARLEGRLVFERLLDRFKTIELTHEPTWKANLTLRGLESLRVKVA